MIDWNHPFIIYFYCKRHNQILSGLYSIRNFQFAKCSCSVKALRECFAVAAIQQGLQALCHGCQCPGDGAAAGCQQFPQDQRDELPLSGRQGQNAGTAQVVGNEAREFAFFVARREFLHDGAARGVGDVRLHLAAQGAFAQRQQTTAQVFQRAFFCFAAVLDAEAVETAEDAVINDADEAVEFKQAVLQRGGSEQDFRADVGQRVLQGFGDDVAFFIDVAQAVRFVEYDKFPGMRLISAALVLANW